MIMIYFQDVIKWLTNDSGGDFDTLLGKDKYEIQTHLLITNEDKVPIQDVCK